MKFLFYISLFLLVTFEILNVYFIMPMPGSQEMNSIGIAYFFYSWRWVFRILFLLGIIAGIRPAFKARGKWIAIPAMLIVGGITWLFNFSMTADKMFLQPEHVVLKPKSENEIPGSRLVIGVENNGVAKAYPIEFLAYHHAVMDTVGGKPVMVTYCSVCRTATVLEPMVKGVQEKFRLVGMDHFNAMFEDEKTGSWWRQATGEAVAGDLKGQQLKIINSVQVSVEKWLELYPDGLIMQADPSFTEMYDPQARFEQGKSKGDLTRTDSLSWERKSWIAGLQIGNTSKAYDWNRLEEERIINDKIGGTPVLLVLSEDGKSFAAFYREGEQNYSMKGDSIFSETGSFSFAGKNYIAGSEDLQPLRVSQEFWHSWLTFHPDTEKY